MEREIMNVRQAAAYLGISPDTLYMYANEKFVPAFKLGNRWRFRRSDIHRWTDEMIEKNSNTSAKTPAKPEVE